MDITIIQRLLGHENVGTTQIYAELNQDIVVQAYNKLIS
jgi:site-specific recombinase XerD